MTVIPYLLLAAGDVALLILCVWEMLACLGIETVIITWRSHVEVERQAEAA